MIPDGMSQWAISRLPGESDASMRERIRREGMPLFAVMTPWCYAKTSDGIPKLMQEKKRIEAAIDLLYVAKTGGYFGPYQDATLSNLANAERCAAAARDLIGSDGLDVFVVNYSDGFRIEVAIKGGPQ
jgi:hypothetical protein